MSERHALDSYIETLQILAREGDADRTDAERERDATHRTKLIDAVAHELAEQIRQAWAAHDPRRPGNVTMLSALNAADLIDPHVGVGAGVTGARDELWDDLGIDPDRISREEFEEYLDVYDRASAGPVRPGEEATT